MIYKYVNHFDFVLPNGTSTTDYRENDLKDTPAYYYFIKK